MTKYKNQYRIESTRAQNWDYGSPGSYFVTICAQNHKCYFGEIVRQQKRGGATNVGTQNFGTVVVETQNFASLRATDIGIIAQRYWAEIPDHFPFVTLDEFVVMPNHIHGVVTFDKPGYSGLSKNVFGPQSQNLASVVRGFKAAVKKYATMHTIDFAWQPRFYDQIITSQESLTIIRKYIIDNPEKWINEKVYKDTRMEVQL